MTVYNYDPPYITLENEYAELTGEELARRYEDLVQERRLNVKAPLRHLALTLSGVFGLFVIWWISENAPDPWSYLVVPLTFFGLGAVYAGLRDLRNHVITRGRNKRTVEHVIAEIARRSHNENQTSVVRPNQHV